MNLLGLTDPQPLSQPKKIWNREYAARRLAAELERLDKDPSYRFSVLMVEMAGFSGRIASHLGYATHNDTWPKVLAFLTGELGPQDACCRLGEDEFLAILPSTAAAEAESLAALLRRTWAAGAAAGTAPSLDVTVAVGASFVKGETIRTLFAVVDQALGEEKDRRRDLAMGARPHIEPMARLPRPVAVLAGNS